MSVRLQILIAICSLVLTLANTISSWMQYKAGDLQARAAIIQLMPQIQVKESLEMRDGGPYYTDSRLEITNEGGPGSNFSVSFITWVVLESSDDSFKQKDLSVMNGFYSVSFSTGLIKGELESIAGYRNNEKFNLLENSVRDASSGKITLSRPMTLLHIEYDDTFQSHRNEFYLVESQGVRHLIERKGWEQWREMETLQKRKRPLDLDQLGTRKKVEEWVSPLFKTELKKDSS